MLVAAIASLVGFTMMLGVRHGRFLVARVLDDRDRYLRPLAQQLATGRINDLDYNRARHFMYDTTSDARDERHADGGA